MNEQGTWVQDHDGKAGLLLNSFRNCMEISSNPTMVFDLNSLIDTVTDLEVLALCFQHEEIDLIIRRMPTDKAPGPDGFNGMFMKRCWSIIKNYFYALL